MDRIGSSFSVESSEMSQVSKGMNGGTPQDVSILYLLVQWQSQVIQDGNHYVLNDENKDFLLPNRVVIVQ